MVSWNDGNGFNFMDSCFIFSFSILFYFIFLFGMRKPGKVKMKDVHKDGGIFGKETQQHADAYWLSSGW